MAYFYSFVAGFLLAELITAVCHYRRTNRADTGDKQEASRICADLERNREEGLRIVEEASAAGATLEDILTLVEHRPCDDNGNAVHPEQE